MEPFESQASKATDPNIRDLLGIIARVVDSQGTILYNYASGHQSLASDAALVDENNTIYLASAGKFIIHIAALQCVQRGLITLDEPVYAHLPELKEVQIISWNKVNHEQDRSFAFRSQSKDITLRQLLTHSSGVGSEYASPLNEYGKSVGLEEGKYYRVEEKPLPLLFEPGDGWSYGSSIDWTVLLVSRLANISIGQYIQEAIFNTLGMSSSAVNVEKNSVVKSRLLQTVRRTDEGLVAADNMVVGLAASVKDVTTLLTDLMSFSPKILKREYADLLFMPQFPNPSSALTDLRSDTETYAAPAGVPASMADPPVNWSLAGLLVEDELTLSHIPAGTVTWNGMPNVIWAMNREKDVAMIFATQLLPVDDDRTVDIAMTFMKCAWKTFG